jgi:hypothetical protein
MGEIADDAGGDQGAAIYEHEIECPYAPFEMSGPQDQTDHVGCEMKQVGMQKAVRDEPPVFASFDCPGIYRAATKQNLGWNIDRAGPIETQTICRDIQDEQEAADGTRKFDQAAILGRQRAHATNSLTRSSFAL